jgi:hypothetical protein
MRNRRRRLPVLLLCAASAWPAMAAQASTSPPPLQVSLSPCFAPSATAPCRVDPAQIQVDIPTDGSVGAVEVSWLPIYRPTSAPAPDTQQVVLSVPSDSAPSGCSGSPSAPQGSRVVCWNWPAVLDYQSSGTPWILNGTYRVTACASTSSCTMESEDPTPSQVTASSSGGSVTLAWKSGPEPDLVGYTISRNNQPVYTCSTDGAGPGAGDPCTNPPSFRDQPGAGNWSYSVSSLRLGADGAASDVVVSPSAPMDVSVAAAGPGSTAGGASGGGPSYGGSTGRAFLPALPPVGTLRPAQQLSGVGGVGASAVPALADNEDSGRTMTGSPAGLPYNDASGLGSPLASGSLLGTEKSAKSLDAAAELALAVIALALAAHVWFLRGELRAASIRVAARRAAQGSAG